MKVAKARTAEFLDYANSGSNRLPAEAEYVRFAWARQSTKCGRESYFVGWTVGVAEVARRSDRQATLYVIAVEKTPAKPKTPLILEKRVDGEVLADKSFRILSYKAYPADEAESIDSSTGGTQA